jgi:hypothetical protein
MNLYDITLPVRTNDGMYTYAEQHGKWQSKALEIAGGFTEFAAADSTGKDGDKVFRDRVIPYRVACEPAQWQKLLDEAFALFHDQLAIFDCQIGVARVTTREQWEAERGLPTVIPANVHHGKANG